MRITDKQSNLDPQEKIRELEAELLRVTLENRRLTETLNQIYASAVNQEGGFKTNPQQSGNFAKTRYSLYADQQPVDNKPAVVLKRVGPTGSSSS